MTPPSERPGDSAAGTEGTPETKGVPGVDDAPETDRWSRIYDWEIFLSAAVGLATTVWLVEPGEQTVGVAALRVDAFYGLVALFGALLVWSGADLWRAYTRN